MIRLSTLALLLLVGSFALVDSVSAQMMASERSQVHQAITGTNIVIDYSRPSVRGRSPVWGGIEPWGTVWTPGANSATTFKFSRDVKLNGTDVAAGKYSVFIELLENDPWNLVLYTDTTMFHVPYPSKDSAMVVIPIHPEEAPSFVETLRFDIENVRVDGADIQFRWADTLVPIRLDVDPGYDMVFTAEEMEPYEGEWLLDTSMAQPADSMVAKWREGMSEEEMEDLDKWLASFAEPNRIVLAYDEATGHMKGVNHTFIEIFGPDDSFADFVLIRKGEGTFVEGNLMDGELMFVNEGTIWEFELDDNGRTDLFQQRSLRDDRLQGEGERAR